MEDHARTGWPAGQRPPDADAWLLEQIRSENAEAGHQFVREHYRAIYRYLLYLTEQPDLAADLTQAGEARFGASRVPASRRDVGGSEAAEKGAERQRRGPGPGRACFGLVEWELARHPVLRPLLRDLAQFAPEQRRTAMSPTGLRFDRMSPAQQQLFLSQALVPRVSNPQAPGMKGWPQFSLDDMEGSVLRIDYTQPGGFEWVPHCPGPWQTWVMARELGTYGRREPRPPVRGRTREATLQAFRRVDGRALPGSRGLAGARTRSSIKECAPPKLKHKASTGHNQTRSRALVGDPRRVPWRVGTDSTAVSCSSSGSSSSPLSPSWRPFASTPAPLPSSAE